MKIACLISSLRLGGAERQLAGLAVTLGATGNDVEVITYREGDFYDALLASAGIRRTRIEGGNDLDLIRKLAEHLRSSGTEVVISFMTGANIKACLAKSIHPDFRLMVSERNFNVRLLPHDSFRFILYRKYADKVVCNCHAQEKLLQARCPELRGKLLTITNAVDFGTFCPAETERSPRESALIVVAARVCGRKNALGLIRAAGILKKEGRSFRVEWYGAEKEDSYFRKCLRCIRKAGLEDYFVMKAASGSIADVYRNADFFCLPSMYEGTSNSLAEALSCGLPVICSRVSDNPLYVREGVNGFLFDPSSPESIALAISKALDMNGEQWTSFSEESLRTALRAFSGERFAAEYSSLIDLQ